MPNEQRPPDDPETLLEWLWRLKRYEKGIFVRHKGESGKWGNESLDKLSPKEWATHVAGWLEGGALPCRVREPEEIEKEKMEHEESET